MEYIPPTPDALPQGFEWEVVEGNLWSEYRLLVDGQHRGGFLAHKLGSIGVHALGQPYAGEQEVIPIDQAKEAVLAMLRQNGQIPTPRSED